MFGRDKVGPRASVVVPAASAQDQTPKLETVLGVNSCFSGTIQSDGDICMNGVFQGNLYAAGNVVVAESATVIAEIQASSATLSGMVKGSIAADKVAITESGKLWGNVTINTIVMHEGAYHEGRTTMATVIAPPSGRS